MESDFPQLRHTIVRSRPVASSESLIGPCVVITTMCYTFSQMLHQLGHLYSQYKDHYQACFLFFFWFSELTRLPSIVNKSLVHLLKVRGIAVVCGSTGCGYIGDRRQAVLKVQLSRTGTIKAI